MHYKGSLIKKIIIHSFYAYVMHVHPEKMNFPIIIMVDCNWLANKDSLLSDTLDKLSGVSESAETCFFTRYM